MIPIGIAAKSDQINAADLAGGQSLIITVRSVRPGPDAVQQPWEIVSDHPTVYRPCKTMRRVIIGCWGGVVQRPHPTEPGKFVDELDWSSWVGKRIELHTDPTVRFGTDVTGGIRIRALSGLRQAWSQSLPVSRGKVVKFVVGVLPDVAQQPAKPATVAPTELPKFVAAVEGLAAGLTVPLLREYLAASGIEIDTLDARALSAVVADLRAPAEVERLSGWMADRVDRQPAGDSNPAGSE